MKLVMWLWLLMTPSLLALMYQQSKSCFIYASRSYLIGDYIVAYGNHMVS